MGTKLRTLGETHARGTVIDGAYFDVFVQATITVLRQELMAEFSARMNFAWIRLLGYVAHQVKEGYRGRSLRLNGRSEWGFFHIGPTPPDKELFYDLNG